MAAAGDLAADREKALALVPVAPAVAVRLNILAELLVSWNASINLVAPSTIPRLWTRHIADSLQLLALAPDAHTWVDLGSGAGFPGLVIACALADQANAQVHLVESNSKKAAFLRTAIRATGAMADVHAVRIEQFVGSFRGHADVVTARALAPLKSLLDQCVGLWTNNTVGLFPKGQDVEAELTEASKYWNIRAELVPSRTDPNGRIVVVRALEQRVGAGA